MELVTRETPPESDNHFVSLSSPRRPGCLFALQTWHKQ